METAEIEFQILPPVGLNAIKNRAVKLRKRFGLRHSFALETTARALGFPDYYNMRCALSRIEPYGPGRPSQHPSSTWKEAQRQRELLVVRTAVPAATDAQVRAFVDGWALARDGLLLHLPAWRLKEATKVEIDATTTWCDYEKSAQFVPPSLDFALQKARLLGDVLGRQWGALRPKAVLASLYNYEDWSELCVAQMTRETSLLDEALSPSAVRQRHWEHVDVIISTLQLERGAAARVIVQCRPTSNSSLRISQRTKRHWDRASQFENFDNVAVRRQPGKLAPKKACSDGD
jgi:hypothetical protein